MSQSPPVSERPSRNDADRPAMAPPTPDETSGRDAHGRFPAGNGGGHGNPFACQVAHLRKVLLRCVTDEEMRIIGGHLVLQAKMGNLVAMKLLFQYMLGKPTASVDPDTLDQQEMGLY